MLLERPDVLAAEHDLMSANANIGAARAQFFPSLTLTASGGLASVALAALFTRARRGVHARTERSRCRCFAAARTARTSRTPRRRRRASIAAYELAIQTAFREVADALATRATIQEALAAQIALVDARQKALELSQARYRAGIDTFLTTLVSERALYAAKNSLVATQLAALGNRVTLYRVLGGGLN